VDFSLPSSVQFAPGPEPLVGTSAVAELVGHTEQWVQAQAKAGTLTSYRLGGHLRFCMSEVVAWIDAQVTR
jgi:excisionase family DNA binding protein